MKVDLQSRVAMIELVTNTASECPRKRPFSARLRKVLFFGDFEAAISSYICRRPLGRLACMKTLVNATELVSKAVTMIRIAH